MGTQAEKPGSDQYGHYHPRLPRAGLKSGPFQRGSHFSIHTSCRHDWETKQCSWNKPEQITTMTTKPKKGARRSRFWSLASCFALACHVRLCESTLPPPGSELGLELEASPDRHCFAQPFLHLPLTISQVPDEVKDIKRGCSMYLCVLRNKTLPFMRPWGPSPNTQRPGASAGGRGAKSSPTHRPSTS